jgi:hypothetical protein
MWDGFASNQRSNVKSFLFAIAEIGLPCFSVKDLEEVRLLPFIAVNIPIVNIPPLRGPPPLLLRGPPRLIYSSAAHTSTYSCAAHANPS